MTFYDLFLVNCVSRCGNVRKSQRTLTVNHAKNIQKVPNLEAPIASSRLILSSAETLSSLVTNNVDQDQTAPVVAI